MTTTTKTLAGAFLEAQAEMENPKKNANNPAFKSKYANLEELIAVTKPVLNALGLALVQEPVSDENGVGVRTRIIGHGEEMDFGAYTVPLAKRDAQGAGSAITYCRRYALASIFALAQEDDDGHAASTPAPKPADDPEFDRIMKLAQKNDTLDAVKRAVCDPYDSKAARAIFAAYSTTERQVLESMATKVTASTASK